MFIAPAAATTYWGAAGMGATKAGLGYVGKQLLNNEPIDGKDLIVSMGFGAASGIFGKYQSNNRNKRKSANRQSQQQEYRQSSRKLKQSKGMSITEHNHIQHHLHSHKPIMHQAKCNKFILRQ